MPGLCGTAGGCRRGIGLAGGRPLGQLRFDGGNMSEPALAGTRIETELNWKVVQCGVARREQRQLLWGLWGVDVVGHVCIITKGCDRVLLR